MKRLFWFICFCFVVAFFAIGQPSVNAGSIDATLEKIITKKPAAERNAFITKLEKALLLIKKKFEAQKNAASSHDEKAKKEKVINVINLLIKALPTVKSKVLSQWKISSTPNNDITPTKRLMENKGILWVYYDEKKDKAFAVAATATEQGLYEVSTSNWSLGKKHDWKIISNSTYFDYKNEIIYAANLLTNSIDKYDLRHHRITSLTLDFQPHSIAAIGKTLYVSPTHVSESNQLHAINLSNFSSIGVVEDEKQQNHDKVSGKSKLIGFNDILYIVAPGSSSQLRGYVMNGNTMTTRKNVTIGQFYTSIEFEGKMYVHGHNNGSFDGWYYPINNKGELGSYVTIAPSRTPATKALWFTQDGRYYIVAYWTIEQVNGVAREYDAVVKYDTQTNKIVDSIKMPENTRVTAPTTHLNGSDHLVYFLTIKNRTMQWEYLKKIDFSRDLDQFLE